METSTDSARAMDSIRSTATDIDQRVRELARKQPIVSALGALFIGFVAARLMSRRQG